MLKAGAHDGASGEKAINYNAPRVDLIVGSFQVVIPNAMLGEVTPLIATSIMESPARKILLPANISVLKLVGLKEQNLSGHLAEVKEEIDTMLL